MVYASYNLGGKYLCLANVNNCKQKTGQSNQQSLQRKNQNNNTIERRNGDAMVCEGF